MTNHSTIRVRFAPAPTGMMHLGNVRTALMNFVFAKQKKGIFVIRIEDTDQQRNYDPQALKIISDLTWLGIDYDEGPVKNGPYVPYFQSQRDAIYQKYLQELQVKNYIYRCFCTPEELEKKRERQIALKMPPRYDRTCLKRSPAETQRLLEEQTPFIWRVQLDQTKSTTITDLAHGKITFEFKNFSDFPLTRTDGTVTFLFANFVDDMVMKMTHVIRGEDHLTNTACQAALYEMFDAPIPIFWHLPILCNAEGKKLSKRDFGFSLNDLIESGYLPEAINNYLATIGGGTFDQELLSLDDIIAKMNLDSIHSTGHVRYDVEKLRWLNHKWIDRLTPEELSKRCLPYLVKTFAHAHEDKHRVTKLLQMVKSELQTLADAPTALMFVYIPPVVTREDLEKLIPAASIEALATIIKNHLPTISQPTSFVDALKTDTKAGAIPMPHLFMFVRMALMGKAHGPSILELIEMLGSNEATERLKKLI